MNRSLSHISAWAIRRSRDSLRIVKDDALTDVRQRRMFSDWRTVTFTQRCDTAVTRDVTPRGMLRISPGFIHLSFRSSALAIPVRR